jgi:hypothetical protein
MNVVSAAFARFAVGGLSAISCAAFATEGGTTNYAIGAQTVAAAYMPPKGATEFYGYVAYIHSGSLRDNDGHSAAPGFDAQVIAAAPRVMSTWGSYQGFDLSSGGFAEFLYAKVRVGGLSEHSAGADLLGIEPLTVTRHVGDWHFLIGSAIYIPVGEYHRGQLAPSTSHYGGGAFQLGATWMPTPRWDLSINPDILINQRNKATGYHSGSVFGLTSGVNWRPLANDLRWQVGLTSYYEEQVSDDHLQDQKIPDGYRKHKLAFGPQFAFWPSPSTVWLLKWQHEFEVRNAPRGDVAWFEFAFPL